MLPIFDNNLSEKINTVKKNTNKLKIYMNNWSQFTPFGKSKCFRCNIKIDYLILILFSDLNLGPYT